MQATRIEVKVQVQVNTWRVAVEYWRRWQQVMRKSINVGHKLAVEKPIVRVAARWLQGHNGLQKFRPHFTTSTKLCPDQSESTMVAPSKNAVQHGIQQPSVHSSNCA